MPCVSLSWQIRVVNAFRMGLAGADSFDKRSLSSFHSHPSLPTLRSAAVMLAEQRRPMSAGDDGTVFLPTDEAAPRV